MSPMGSFPADSRRFPSSTRRASTHPRSVNPYAERKTRAKCAGVQRTRVASRPSDGGLRNSFARMRCAAAASGGASTWFRRRRKRLQPMAMPSVKTRSVARVKASGACSSPRMRHASSTDERPLNVARAASALSQGVRRRSASGAKSTVTTRAPTVRLAFHGSVHAQAARPGKPEGEVRFLGARPRPRFP